MVGEIHPKYTVQNKWGHTTGVISLKDGKYNLYQFHNFYDLYPWKDKIRMYYHNFVPVSGHNNNVGFRLVKNLAGSVR